MKPWTKEYFIATDDGFICGDCNEDEDGPHLDVSDPKVEVWRFYTDGWTGPCVCDSCDLSIPIFVDGDNDDDEDEDDE